MESTNVYSLRSFHASQEFLVSYIIFVFVLISRVKASDFNRGWWGKSELSLSLAPGSRSICFIFVNPYLSLETQGGSFSSQVRLVYCIYHRRPKLTSREKANDQFMKTSRVV